MTLTPTLILAVPLANYCGISIFLSKGCVPGAPVLLTQQLIRSSLLIAHT